MKLFVALLLLTLAPLPTHAGGPVYFDTEKFPSAAQTKLIAGAVGTESLSASQVRDLLAAYEADPSFAKIIEAYHEGLYRELKIDPLHGEKWQRKYPKLYKGINNYVGSSDEGMGDEDPSWQTINGKLRAGEAFNEVDKQFVAEILYSMSRLPTARGLVFRGQAMTKERFAEIKEGKVWVRPAFTSTTLSPNTAGSFGRGQEGYSYTGIVVIKTKGGAPVSPLTFDTGFQGQPGRIGEREVLLAPGAKLFVHAKLTDEANRTYYILAEER